MQRDLTEYKKWEDWHRAIYLEEFEKKKAKAIADAEAMEDQKAREVHLKKAHKMVFQFDKAKMIQYGYCTKFDKSVTFIPNTCQIETQHCFIHRRDVKNDSIYGNQ